jgi:PAS domain S-box-containing protein
VAVAQVVLSDGLAHIAFVTDITERTRAEAKLRESEERFRKLFEESPLGIAFLDTQREITLINQRYRGFLGFSEAEICERGPAGIVHPEDWGPALSLSDRLRAGEIPLFHMELRYIRGDGSVVWADTHITALHDKDGRLTNTISWVQDITARKTAEAEKVKLEDQLRQAQKMESVGRLAGGVAHDFNNMLGVILGHAEMALEQVDPTQRLYDSLTEIRTAAEHSADLTRQLLSFARKQAISPRVLDLNRAVGGTVKMLQRMIGEDITITWQPEPDVWPVVMDPSQIDQILANLCVNARDAIAGVGRIAIRTRHTTLESGFCAAHPGAVAGEYVQLDVSDNGCGMDEMTLSHIFEPFFTTKGAGKGTGLGLATVFGIVKQNNGFINVESEAGRGTTFSIYLPRCLGEAAQGQGQDAARSTPRGQGTILVVEDDPAILKLVTMMLKQLGYKVLAANTIKEATRLAEENTAEIGLLLTDVIMPESNGRELTKRLRTVCPHIKVLFMSGYAADIIAHQGVLEEGECFIQKPFSAKALANKIQETFAR